MQAHHRRHYPACPALPRTTRLYPAERRTRSCRPSRSTPPPAESPARPPSRRCLFRDRLRPPASARERPIATVSPTRTPRPAHRRPRSPARHRAQRPEPVLSNRVHGERVTQRVERDHRRRQVDLRDHLPHHDWRARGNTGRRIPHGHRRRSRAERLKRPRSRKLRDVCVVHVVLQNRIRNRRAQTVMDDRVDRCGVSQGVEPDRVSHEAERPDALLHAHGDTRRGRREDKTERRKPWSHRPHVLTGERATELSATVIIAAVSSTTRPRSSRTTYPTSRWAPNAENRSVSERGTIAATYCVTLHRDWRCDPVTRDQKAGPAALWATNKRLSGDRADGRVGYRERDVWRREYIAVGIDRIDRDRYRIAQPHHCRAVHQNANLGNDARDCARTNHDLALMASGPHCHTQLLLFGGVRSQQPTRGREPGRVGFGAGRQDLGVATNSLPRHRGCRQWPARIVGNAQTDLGWKSFPRRSQPERYRPPRPQWRS